MSSYVASDRTTFFIWEKILETDELGAVANAWLETFPRAEGVSSVSHQINAANNARAFIAMHDALMAARKAI